MKKILQRFVSAMIQRGYLQNVSDETYLKLLYWARLGNRLNLNSPKKFTEKLQWLKLNYRRSEYTQMVDKLAMKDWVTDRIGSGHVVPVLGVWNSAEEIDVSELPEQFVMKTNHDSGSVVICTDKSAFDLQQAKKIMSESLGRNYYYSGREWPYKDVKPLVFAEEYISADKDCSSDLRSIAAAEYDFFCFDGEVGFVTICHGEKDVPGGRRNDFYTKSFEPLPVKCGYESCAGQHEKPALFDAMIELAEKLSRGIPELRVDLYEHDGSILVGELTFFHWSGLCRFDPPEWDEKFGSLIVLPK